MLSLLMWAGGTAWANDQPSAALSTFAQSHHASDGSKTTTLPSDSLLLPQAIKFDTELLELTEVKAEQKSAVFVPMADSAVAPAEVTSKSRFLAGRSSHKAANLKLPQPIPSTAPHNNDEFRPADLEWIVATTQLPLLSPVRPGLDDEKAKTNPLAEADIESAQSSAPSTSPLRASTEPGSPELPPLPQCDPELGCLRIGVVPLDPAPILYLTPRVDFFRSDNLLLGIDPINAGLVRPNLTLLAIPPIGPNTFIIASVDGAFNRYFEVPEFNYDEFRVRAGILHRLSPVMSMEVGWTNQQLFIASNEIPGFPSGTRFLNDQAVRLELSRRDQLADRLSLTSIYQFRVGFSEPTDRSRILNVAFLSLNYDLNTKRTLQAGIDYQFSAANYTVVKRTDIYQQLLGRLSLTAFGNSQLSVYGGISFGNSTEPGIDFNSYVLGVSVSVNWALF